MANNVTVTPAAAKMVYASGSTDFITVSGNVSGSSSPSYGVGGLHITSDQTNSFGVFIHNKKAGGGNQYSKLELASEDANLMKYHTWDNSAGGLGAERFTQTVTETYALFEARSASNQLYLASGGNVGIGTAGPNQKLDVMGHFSVSSSTATDAIYYSNGNAMMYNNNTHHFFYGGDTSTRWIANDGSSTFMSLMSSGKLGIGDTDPTEKFVVYDATSSNQLGVYADSGDVAAINMYEGTTKSAELLFDGTTDDIKIINRISGGDLVLRVNNSVEGIRITGNTGAVTLGDNSVTNTQTAGNSTTRIATTAFVAAAVAAGGGGGTIGGSLSDNYIPIGTAANTIGDFILGLTENDSIYLGSNPESTTNTAQNNTALGISALNDITTGDNNTAIGIQAGQKITTQERNTIMGVSALRYASGSASYNTAIGFAAMGASDQESISTVAIGYYALSGATSTQATVAVGHLAARDLTTGDHNIAIGKSAMLGNTTSNYSTAIGSESMQLDGAGTSTTVGYYSMNAHSGDNCVGLGAYALRRGTGAYNVGLGVSAMTNVSGGAGGVAVGYQSGYHPTGNYNTWLGYNAGFGTAAAAGYNNVGIGKDSMLNLTSAHSNVAVGVQSFQNVTTAIRGVAIGFQAGSSVSTGDYNVLVGAYAGQAFGTHASNIAIGAFAGQASISDNSVYIGQNVGYYLEGDYNIGMGRQAIQGVANSTAANNIAIGYKSMYQIDTNGNENTAIGFLSMSDTTTATLNVAIGAYAATGMTTGQENVAIGHSALQENQEGDHIVAIGRYAAYNTNPTAGTGDSVVVGTQAGYTNTTGVQNTFIGHRAGYSNTTSNQQVFVGREAGYNHTEGTTNIFIGARSGYLNTTGANNTVVGHQALYNNVHGDRNTAIGYQALHSSTPSDGGGTNTAVGDRAGYTTSTGHSNVYMGYLAGYSLTDGERNVIIGHEAGRLTSTLDFSVLIGNGAGYNSSGASSAVYLGRSAGYFASGNSNTFIGTSAGRGNSTLTHATVSSVAVGLNSMYYHSTANYNVAVGESALMGPSTGLTGDNNVAIGRQAGFSTSTGLSNVFVGAGAGYGATTAQKSVVIGTNAGYALGTHNASTIIGFEAGRFMDAGSGGSVAIGHQALYSGTQNYQDTAIGINAGKKATGASANNVFLGSAAGPSSAGAISNKLYINNAEGTPLIGGDFSGGGTLTFTASGNAPNSVVFKHSQVSSGGEDGITIDAREPRLSLINRRDTDETWKIMANNGNSSLQIIKDSQLVKAIFSPDDGGGVTFGIAAAAATSGVAIAQGASYSLDNTTVNRIYRTSSDVSYMSNELHYFNNPVKVNGNLATASLGQALEFADRDDLLIRGTASYDMEITAPQDVAFGIDSDDNETTHAFLWKKDTKTPSSAGTELMRLNELGRLGIGATSPGSKLDIVSTSNDNTGGIRIGDGSTFAAIYHDSSENLIIDPVSDFIVTGSDDVRIQSSDDFELLADDFYFKNDADNSTMMRITSAGNVGIGITPSELLHLKGGKLEIENSDSSKHLQIDENSIRTTTNNDLSIFSNGNSNQFVLNQSNGRIGMGTSSPDDKLHVYHSTLNTMALFESGDSKSLIKIKDNASTQYVISESSKLSIGGQNELHASNLNVDSAGNVGIGTTSPSQKLDVVGAAQIGTLIVTGSTLAVQRTMKNDVVGAHTFSDSYSHYMATADNQDPATATCTLTCPASPTIGDEYWITARCNYLSLAGGTSLVRITPNTSQTINAAVSAGSYITLNTATSGTNPTYKMAHLICVEADTWALTLSDVGPVA
jgi:hypothetical protein